LERGVHLNQVTGKLFNENDFYPGAVFKVYNREFEVLDPDEYTRKYVECGGSNRQYDLQAVLEKVRESLRQQYPLIRDIFRKFDKDKDGVITQTEFADILHKWGYQPTDEEVLVLMRHFDTREDGQISYNEFCDALLDEDYTQHMLKSKPPLQQEPCPMYKEYAQDREAEREETNKVRNAVRSIGDAIYKKSHVVTLLAKELNKMTHLPTIHWKKIHEAMEMQGHKFHPEDVYRSVVHVMPDSDPDDVNFTEYLKSMVTSYHDLSATR